MNKFAKDTSVTFITRILQLFLGIGISVIISRSLGPYGKGIYSLVILLPGLLITFLNFGIGPASIYYIGKKKYPLKEILGINIIFLILINIFSILIGLIIIFCFGDKLFPNIEKTYLVLSLSLLAPHLFAALVSDILLGLQKIKKYNFIQLIQSFIFLLLIFVAFAFFIFDIKTAIIIESLSSSAVCVYLFFLIKKTAKGITFSLNKNLIKDIFSYGIKVYLSNIFSFLHYRIDRFILNVFLNPLSVGIYSIAAGLSEKIWLISQSAGTILFPKISSETNKENLNKFTPLVCRNILFITTLFAIFLFVISKTLIISLYSEQFSNSLLPFQILLIGAIAISGWKILGSDLYGRGKPLLNVYITGGAVIVNIILNIILIPRIGIKGAAWASSISYSITLVIVTIVYSKISRNKITDIIFIKKSDFKYYKNIMSHSLSYLRKKINL